MTEELRTKSILSMYEDLTILGSCPHIILVREKSTGLLFVKKILENYDEQVFLQLKNHPLPGIPKIFHILHDETSLILIEQFINGQTLQSLLQKGPLSEDDALAVFDSISDTLSSLHAMHPPIIHRDIKATNVMLTKDGTCYLIDFNAARNYDENKTKDTVVLGTEGYAPPEQYGFAQTDHRSDVYSFAVLLHVMLTGKYPKEGLFCRKEINHVLKKALSLSPQERFADITEFRNAVHRAVAPRPEHFLSLLKQCFFALPGIRSHSLLKTGGFLLWCLFFVYTGVHSSMSPTHSLSNQISKFLATISLFCMYFLCTDYLHMRNHFPGTKHPNRLCRYGILVGYCFLFLLIAALISGVCDFLFP